MALRLDRLIQLILVGERSGGTFEEPTRTPTWGRLLRYDVESDITEAGDRPSGLAKVAIRYRESLSTRISFPGAWTPTTTADHLKWDRYTSLAGDVQDSFAVDGVVFILLETSQLLEQDRRRYVVLFGQANKAVG